MLYIVRCRIKRQEACQDECNEYPHTHLLASAVELGCAASPPQFPAPDPTRVSDASERRGEREAACLDIITEKWSLQAFRFYCFLNVSLSDFTEPFSSMMLF